MAPRITSVTVAAGFMLLGASCFFTMASADGDGGASRYNAMFNFGDSLSDTGNLCVNKSAAEELLLTFANPPYGMTYFGHPTCRCSDGRLVVDFLAQSLGLPLLPPSKLPGADFRKGTNMAIVGATALDFEFLKSIGLGYPIWNNGAINVQLQWFRDLLPRVCGGPQSCRPYLARSLFLLGSIGGNYYNAMLFFGFNISRAKSYAPNVFIGSNPEAGYEFMHALFIGSKKKGIEGEVQESTSQQKRMRHGHHKSKKCYSRPWTWREGHEGVGAAWLGGSAAEGVTGELEEGGALSFMVANGGGVLWFLSFSKF